MEAHEYATEFTGRRMSDQHEDDLIVLIEHAMADAATAMREKCAKIAEDFPLDDEPTTEKKDAAYDQGIRIAAAIRKEAP